MTDGGADTSGTGQVSLSRDPGRRQIAEVDTDDERRPVCPDCGIYVGASKSGGKELPGRDATAFGWECPACNLTLPSNCFGSDAPGFNHSMGGLEVEFRDGQTRWVPVPVRYVDTGTEQGGQR